MVSQELFDFLKIHFDESDFNGRVQVGCRGRKCSVILPALTCDYKKLISVISDFYVISTSDYYITANAFSGVRRFSNDLFSLHNLVIDIDCHGDYGSLQRAFWIDSLLWRLEHDLFDVYMKRPTSIVKTGRGLQFWWALEGISVKFLNFYNEIKTYYIGLFQNIVENSKFEDFSMFSVDIVASKNNVGFYRLPGTYNTLVGTLVTFSTNAIVYRLMDLFDHMKDFIDVEYNLKQCSDSQEFKPTTGMNYLCALDLRLKSFYKLRDLRNLSIGEEQRNNFSFMVYNALVPVYGHDLSFIKLKQFNCGFKLPMTDAELCSVVSTAKQKQGYFYSTLKIKEFLNISDTEFSLLYLTENQDGAFVSSNKKRAKAVVKKNLRDEQILKLYDSGKTATVVSEELKISLPTVTKILSLNHRSHKQNRKNQIQKYYESGKDVKEIAALCQCSYKTVKRVLALISA